MQSVRACGGPGLEEADMACATGTCDVTVETMLTTSAVLGAARAFGVAAVLMDERDCDMQGIALPRPEIRLVGRFGPVARNGLEVHALGVRPTVKRKLLRSGQRTVAVSLPPGASEAVLGVPASSLTGRIVALDDLWTTSAVQQLYDRLAEAPDNASAAAVLEHAVSGRLARIDLRARTQRVLDAAARLSLANVNAVAAELGLSERQLRRVFHDALGISPKVFSKLTRFARALDAAHPRREASWAGIAATAGYYDQAHLIAEFRAIAGVTPRALLGELSTARRF